MAIIAACGVVQHCLSEGEVPGDGGERLLRWEVLITRRGGPVARILPVPKQISILAAGGHDPTMIAEALSDDS